MRVYVCEKECECESVCMCVTGSVSVRVSVSVCVHALELQGGVTGSRAERRVQILGQRNPQRRVITREGRHVSCVRTRSL